MEGCRGADLYASKRESRRAAGACEECGDEHRDVKGEISAEVHSSTLNVRELGCGDDPKEKFSLNISADIQVARGAGRMSFTTVELLKDQRNGKCSRFDDRRRTVRPDERLWWV
ncbi:hypothetical protein PHISCL_10574, partial [Aspergillus sclerotialis]